MDTEVLTQGQVGVEEAYFIDNKYAYLGVLTGVLLFQAINWLTQFIPPANPTPLSKDEYRNLLTSWTHSVITGVGAILGFIMYPKILEDPVLFINPYSYALTAISSGYFIFDIIDGVKINGFKDKSVQLDVIQHSNGKTDDVKTGYKVSGDATRNHRNGTNDVTKRANDVIESENNNSDAINDVKPIGNDNKTAHDIIEGIKKGLKAKYDVILHHIFMVLMFVYNLLICHCVGFVVITLYGEFNTIFLHMRKILQVHKVDFNSTLYRANAWVNLVTFMTCRFGALGAILLGMAVWSHRVSRAYYITLSVSVFVVGVTQVIILRMVLKSDFFRPNKRMASSENGSANQKVVSSENGSVNKIQNGAIDQENNISKEYCNGVSNDTIEDKKSM